MSFRLGSETSAAHVYYLVLSALIRKLCDMRVYTLFFQPQIRRNDLTRKRNDTTRRRNDRKPCKTHRQGKLTKHGKYLSQIKVSVSPRGSSTRYWSSVSTVIKLCFSAERVKYSYPTSKWKKNKIIGSSQTRYSKAYNPGSPAAPS